MILALVVGCFVAGCVTDDSATEETGTVTEYSSSPCSCENSPTGGVLCTGNILVLPVNIDIKNVGILNNFQLIDLSNSLNNINILNGSLNDNLSKIELVVLNKFLNDFVIAITHNDVNVCAVAVLGGLICK
jgi:hypothetical protein